MNACSRQSSLPINLNRISWKQGAVSKVWTVAHCLPINLNRISWKHLTKCCNQQCWKSLPINLNRISWKQGNCWQRNDLRTGFTD